MQAAPHCSAALVRMLGTNKLSPIPMCGPSFSRGFNGAAALRALLQPGSRPSHICMQLVMISRPIGRGPTACARGLGKCCFYRCSQRLEEPLEIYATVAANIELAIANSRRGAMEIPRGTEL
jgi:hypothetical protein